jgi:hypothetical protein
MCAAISCSVLCPGLTRGHSFRRWTRSGCSRPSMHCLFWKYVHATCRLMSAPVLWRGMFSDITASCRDCQQCARGKASLIQSIPVPERRFTHIYMDIVGPQPASAEGYSYLFIQVHQMAGCNPYQVHLSSELCGHFHLTVGDQICGPGHHLI